MGSYDFTTFNTGPVAPLFVEYVGAAATPDDLVDAKGRQAVFITLHGIYMQKRGMIAVALRVEEAAMLINAIRLSGEHNGVWPAVQALLDQVQATSKDEGWTLRGPEKPSGE